MTVHILETFIKSYRIQDYGIFIQVIYLNNLSIFQINGRMNIQSRVIKLLSYFTILIMSHLFT